MRRTDTAMLLCLPFALVVCGGDPEPGASAPAPEPTAVEAGAAADAAPAETPPPAAEARPTEFWLLREFDWGDTKETVYESVEYTDGFLCYRHKLREHCAFVKTRVDGEELLANFHFVDDVLWRADIVTPELDEVQAAEHLERVWKLLAAYVTRFQGEAPEQASFGDWKQLTPGQMRVTHRWVQPKQELRIVVGRGKGDAPGWFTAVRAVDPKWAPHEPQFVADAK
jgi:hypothetical protein